MSNSRHLKNLLDVARSYSVRSSRQREQLMMHTYQQYAQLHADAFQQMLMPLILNREQLKYAKFIVAMPLSKGFHNNNRDKHRHIALYDNGYAILPSFHYQDKYPLDDPEHALFLKTTSYTLYPYDVIVLTLHGNLVHYPKNSVICFGGNYYSDFQLIPESSFYLLPTPIHQTPTSL